MLGWGWGPRRALLRAVPGLAPAAATVFGIRIGRGIVLRGSALLAARSALASVDLPLDLGVASYVWSLLFASVQTSVALSAAAAYLDWGGVLGSLGSRLFAPSDAAFVSIYAGFVLVAGPVCSLVEAGVMTWEIMRVARIVEDKALAAEAVGRGRAWKTFFVSVTVACYIVCGLLAHVLQQALNGGSVIPAAIGAIATAFATVSLMADNANVLEGGALALYAACITAAGVLEELSAPTIALRYVSAPATMASTLTAVPFFGSGSATSRLLTKEVRAVLLLTTSTLILTSLARAPRFFRTVLSGVEALTASDAAYPQQEPLDAPPAEWWRGLVNALAVVVLTFRILIWSGETQPGEYYPLLCRAVQALAVALLYICFLRVEAGDDHAVAALQARSAEPLRDIAGDVVEE